MKKAVTTRRKFLQSLALGGPAVGLGLSQIQAKEPFRRPRVAVIYTVAYHRAHAHVILENFLRPYLFRGQLTNPSVEVVSLYADQRADPKGPNPDMTDDIARQFKLPVFRRIEDALTLQTKNLAVDGVLSIAEQGSYPFNALGQEEYPRKRFFDEAVAVMQKHQRFIPFFNDKHLSYRWDWAQEMYETARKLGIPFMAGSSVPLAQRRPDLPIPANSAMEEIVAIHGGPFERYDFHGLEIMQSIVEFRRGGETGVQSVEFWNRQAMIQNAERRRWNPQLAVAALRAEYGDNYPDWQRPFSGHEPWAIHLRYRDGLKATVLKIGYSSTRWNLTLKLGGEEEPRSTTFYVGPWNNRLLFMALSNAIQNFIRTRTSPYPVERTLLTTGLLEAAIRSRANQGKPQETPHLRIAYQHRDFRAFCEDGATWKILTEDIPQPRGIGPLPIRNP